MMEISRLRSDFSKFTLHGIRETGVEIGRGAYAVVEELHYRGLTCAGKSLHATLYDDVSRAGSERLLSRFEEECQLMRNLRHPNIVQFLGVYFKKSSPLPVIVMELMHASLYDLVDHHGKLPNEISSPILRDVAVGLSFLHSHAPTPIIHRDLTTSNILLTCEFTAKIADLGMAKILSKNPQGNLTEVPGNPYCMPPEALVNKPSYDTKLDVFSYGVIMVHVLSGKWPEPTQPFRRDPSKPGTPVPATEEERRMEYLQLIEAGHPLISLIQQCLNNDPANRPETSEVCAQVSEAHQQFPPVYKNQMEMLQEIKAVKDKNTLLQHNVEEMQIRHEKEMQAVRDEIALLQNSAEEMENVIAAQKVQHEKELHIRHISIKDLQAEITSQSEMLRARDEVATSLRAQLDALRIQSDALRAQLDAAERSSMEKEKKISSLHEVITATRVTVAFKGKEDFATSLRAQLDALRTQLDAAERSSMEKEKEISSLCGEIRTITVALKRKDSTISELGTQLQVPQRVTQVTDLPDLGPPASAVDPFAYVSTEGFKTRTQIGLNCDALILLATLPEKEIPGVHYDISSGTVLIMARTEQELKNLTSRFQAAYQGITARKIKTTSIQPSHEISDSQTRSIIDKFRSKYSKCTFMYFEGAVRIVSTSSWQFDRVVKLFKEELKSHKGASPSSRASTRETVVLPHGRILTLKKANIVEERVEVIVNAANGKLSHTGGVAKAIDEASLGAVQRNSTALVQHNGEVQVGDVAVTHAGGNLQCTYVFHAVRPTKSDHNRDHYRQLLVKVINGVLQQAEAYAIQSIAIPAISSGIFGVSKQLVAESVISAILGYKFGSSPPTLSDIRIVIIDDPTYQCFAQHFRQRKTQQLPHTVSPVPVSSPSSLPSPQGPPSQGPPPTAA